MGSEEPIPFEADILAISKDEVPGVFVGQTPAKLISGKTKYVIKAFPDGTPMGFFEKEFARLAKLLHTHLTASGKNVVIHDLEYEILDKPILVD